MKAKLLAITLALSGVFAAKAAGPPVGEVSQDVAFATWNAANQLENKKLSDFANKVVVLFYYTPW